jgi:NADPH:quinone reductase-like Zn-dependent oxidoreductase
MRALRFHKTGSLDELHVEEVSKPNPAADEVLVQIKAAAINPSDLKNVQGKMRMTTVPRIPGRDFAGVVVEGPAELSGKAVFGSGGDLGFRRDGSHAEFLAVPTVTVTSLPSNLSFEQAAGMGVAYITAWAALVSAAKIQAGETALILGTTGAVGSAAARIAHDLGARVIGTARKAADIPTDGFLPVDDWIDLQTVELGVGARKLTNGRGADVNFYHNESRLFGVDSLKMSFAETCEILRRLTPGIEAGKFKAPPIETFSLEQGPQVYRDVAESKIRSKPILLP